MADTNNSAKPLAGLKAIVTGSTSGIGLGIARALANAGANITINGFGDAAAIEKERVGLETDFGIKARYSAANMAKPDEVRAMVADAEKEFGRVDILVNNAGIQHVAPIDEFPLDKWDAIIAINMSSNFHAIAAALPGMKERNFGRIVNIASAHGLVASPYKAAYISAKHGVVGMTKTVALEVAEHDITCNAICPGFVATPLVEGQIDGQAKANKMTREQVIRDVILDSQPTKRFVEVDEVAALTVHLASPANKSITGAALSIDGGWTAR